MFTKDLFFQLFNITIALIGSAWIIWLIYDINKYTEMMKKYRLSGGESGMFNKKSVAICRSNVQIVIDIYV